MADWLKQWAKDRGFEAAWGDLRLLDVISKDIDDLASSSMIDRALYDTLFKPAFRYRPRGDAAVLANVVIVSVPRPHHYLVFETESGPFKAVLPCTYVGYSAMSERIQNELIEYHALQHPGKILHIERLGAPLKSVAARTGIVTYGRNNISYTPRSGSSHQLVGFYTDASPDEPLEPVDPRRGFGSGDGKCSGCEACVRACPTGALLHERFALQASACLTHINEHLGAWPESVSPEIHNCLVGCMKCQEACPQNRGKIRFEPAHESFTIEETEALLDSSGAGLTPGWSRPNSSVWDSVHRKLVSLGLDGYEPLIGRNLKAIIEAGAGYKG